MRAFKTAVTASAVGALVAVGGATANATSGGPDPEPLVSLEQTAEDLWELYEETGQIDDPLPLDSIPGAGDESVPDEVQELANRLWEDAPAGFGDVEWNPATRDVTLYWHGTVDAEVQADVATIATPVHFESMEYSRETLAENAQASLEIDGVVMAAGRADGSGLELTIDSQVQSRRATPDAQAISTSLPDPSIPVEITLGDAPTQAVDDRDTPSAPYPGGARIKINSSTQGMIKLCSSGFPVLIDPPYVPGAGSTYGMAFAAHCTAGVGANPYWSPRASNYFFGTQNPAHYNKSSVDLAVLVNSSSVSGVELPNKIYFPYLFVGPNAGASRYIIDGTAAPIIGVNWCTSGAPSGTHCGATINSTSIYVDYGQDMFENVGPLVRTQTNDGLRTVGQGDSGGPAHRINADGQPFARSAGILSGIQGGTANSCWQSNDGRLCSNIALISPLPVLMDALNIRAMTAHNYKE